MGRSEGGRREGGKEGGREGRVRKGIGNKISDVPNALCLTFQVAFRRVEDKAVTARPTGSSKTAERERKDNWRGEGEGGRVIYTPTCSQNDFTGKTVPMRQHAVVTAKYS